MPKIISIQEDFSAGQVSFRLKGRASHEKYGSALDIAINCRVLAQGPIEKRNGTLIINRVKDPQNPPRFLRFIVSTSQSFILEFGVEYVRFFVDNGLVQDSEVPGTAFELKTPYTLEQVFELQVTQSEFSLILTHKNVIQQEIIFFGGAPDNWSIEDFIASPPPTFEPGFFPDATLTAASETGLGVIFTASVDTFSSADVGRSIEAIEPELGVASIKTFTNSTTVVADIIADFEPGFSLDSGQWLIDLSPLIELSFNDIIRVGGIVTITTVPNTAGVFRDEFIGDYILVNGGVLQILTVTATNNGCEAEILKSMTNSDNSANWTLEEPTWGGERGFPSTVTQAQQRLLFAGSIAQPQTIWPSETGIINGFGIGIENDDSFEIDIVSNELATINWMNVSKDIIIGTTGGESTINISSATLTPNINELSIRSSYRSNPQSTITVGSELLFVQKGERKILTYFFNLDVDTFVGDDLTFLSENITKSGIKQIAYAQEPNNQILVVTNDGFLLSGTYDRKQNVIGFTQYQTDGKFLSVQTIPKGEIDQVWVVVERMVQGSKQVFVEVFDESSGEDSVDVFTDSSLVVSNPVELDGVTTDTKAQFISTDHGLEVGDQIMFKQFEQWADIDKQVFFVTVIIDDDVFECGYDSASQPDFIKGPVYFKTIQIITGLDHLEGKTVVIKADNGKLPNQEVVNGSVNLNPDEIQGQAYAEVVIGLDQQMRMKTLPKDFDGGIGTMMTQTKRVVRPVLVVDRSSNPIVNGNLKPTVTDPQTTINLDQAMPLFTGQLIYPGGPWGTGAELDIVTDGPFPFRLLAIYGTYDSNYK